jgi:hypothetical protein
MLTPKAEESKDYKMGGNGYFNGKVDILSRRN